MKQPELVTQALEASQQCITDFLEIYERGGSLTVLDLAVRDLKHDALKKVKLALATSQPSGGDRHGE